MELYRYSPIKSKEGLIELIKHIHFECCKLCMNYFGYVLPNAGNVGIFCQSDEEYNTLIEIRKEISESSDNPNQKYFRLHEPIVIPADGEIPETTYAYLYIRKPEVGEVRLGDIDFYLESEDYKKLKVSLPNGKTITGARVYNRKDLDMIELSNAESDVVAYVSTKQMTENARVKQSEETNL